MRVERAGKPVQSGTSSSSSAKGVGNVASRPKSPAIVPFPQSVRERIQSMLETKERNQQDYGRVKAPRRNSIQDLRECSEKMDPFNEANNNKKF